MFVVKVLKLFVEGIRHYMHRRLKYAKKTSICKKCKLKTRSKFSLITPLKVILLKVYLFKIYEALIIYNKLKIIILK